MGLGHVAQRIIMSVVLLRPSLARLTLIVVELGNVRRGTVTSVVVF